jgi:ATP-binding cassette, subfamily B, bacterial
VKEPPLLLAMERVIGRVEVEDDLLRWPLVRLQEQIDQQVGERRRVVTDLVIAIIRPQRGVLEPVERALAAERGAVRALRLELLGKQREHRIVAQLVVVGERLRYHVQQMIMRHANTLDLADFEDPAHYDELQQAQREASSRPLGMVNSVFGLLQSIITFVTMAGLLLQLEWWIAAVVLLSPIPAFLSGANYSMRGFRQAVRLSPARRLMDYLRSLVTTDSFNNEIKVFRLGDYFVRRYAEVAEDAYKETRDLAVKRQLAVTGWGAVPVIATSGTFL